MSRIIGLFTSLGVIVFAESIALADPADLLTQAIEEDQAATRPTDKTEHQVVKKLISEADRLVAQRKFNRAVALYRRAYRLAPSDQDNYVRLLVAKRAAGVMTEQDRRALEIIQEGRAAQVDQVFRAVQLKMIQARQALHDGDHGLAEAQVIAGLAMLDRLGDSVNVAPYRRKLKAILRGSRHKAREASKVSQALRRHGVVAVDGSTIVVTRPVEPGDTTKGPTLMDAGAKSQETVLKEDKQEAENIDVDEVLGETHRRHVYDRRLTRALRRSRARIFVNQNQAAMPPLRDMTFPVDWTEKTARRSKYRGGLIHKGKPFVGKDGKTYYTAIYDLGDLVHPVPNFYATYPGTAYEQRRETLDRLDLRERSQIFNGYAEDLAEGLPLLPYFGGIDNNALSTRTDPQETERILQILDQFIHDQ